MSQIAYSPDTLPSILQLNADVRDMTSILPIIVNPATLEEGGGNEAGLLLIALRATRRGIDPGPAVQDILLKGNV